MTTTEERQLLPTYVTVEDYLALEEAAETKHEYFEGQIIAMAGASPNHNLIATALLILFSNSFDDAGIDVQAFNTDQKVRIDDNGPFFYPDLSITLSDPQFDNSGCLRNPFLLVEVLSKSSSSFDRDEKFRAYRRLPSLRHFFLVSQDKVRVEHFERLPGDVWALVGEHEQMTDLITIADFGVTVLVAKVYHRTHFH